ncbi:MAG: fimbrillin family protein [Bacteroidales bacterium]|nr:fimbrillin family protein [Bacteroidales bacterium]
MKKLFVAILAAAAVLAACNKTEVKTPVSDEARVVKFGVTNFYSFETKAALAVSGHVAIYAGAPINALNCDYTVATMPTAEPAAAGTLNGTAIKWGVEQMGTDTDTKFFAMYPYENVTARDNFDQSHALTYEIEATAESEAYAKDFLVDVVDQHPGADVEHPNTVTFNLHHPFAMLRYVITNTSDDAIRKVEIYGVHKTGTLAYPTAAVTPSGDAIASGSPREMVLESTVDNVKTFYSVIMPESAAINPTIKVTTWGGCTSTYSLSAAQTFLAGKTYTAAITYSNVHTAVTSNRNLTATFDVTDWSAAAAPTVGAQAGYDGNEGNWPFLKGEGFGSSWEEGVPMTCYGENSFKKVLTMTGDGEFKVYKSTGPVWQGVGSTVNNVEDTGWTKVVLSTDGLAANIAVTATSGKKCTVHYYPDASEGAGEVWFKVDDAESAWPF